VSSDRLDDHSGFGGKGFNIIQVPRVLSQDYPEEFQADLDEVGCFRGICHLWTGLVIMSKNAPDVS
jgi:hypothetical protein